MSTPALEPEALVGGEVSVPTFELSHFLLLDLLQLAVALPVLVQLSVVVVALGLVLVLQVIVLLLQVLVLVLTGDTTVALTRKHLSAAVLLQLRQTRTFRI